MERAAAVTSLAFGSVSAYQAVSPATATLHAAGESESANSTITLAAGTVHTIVVLDGSKGLVLDNLLDAAGSGDPPAGAAATGFGGTAARVPSSMAWCRHRCRAAARRCGRAWRPARPRRLAGTAPSVTVDRDQEHRRRPGRRPGTRRPRWLAAPPGGAAGPAAGLLVAVAGAAGLALTRHPVAGRFSAPRPCRRRPDRSLPPHSSRRPRSPRRSR